MKKFITFLFIIFLLSNICFSQSGWFWQNPYPTGNYLEKVRFYDENIGYAVGWRGTVIKTTNGGDNWFLSNSGVPAGILRCLFIFDSNKIVAGGNGIIKTTNGGLNWQLLNTVQAEDIFFVNNNTGYCVSNNTIFKTINGGYNWSSNFSYIGGTLNSIYFINENTGYGPCTNALLKTTNSGTNWFTLSVPVPITMVLFVDQNTGFGVSSRYILKTTNAGLNWNIKCYPNHSLGGEISFCNRDTGYYTNYSGKVYKTFNSGETWDSSNAMANIIISSLSSPQNNTCIVVGVGGSIFKSSNNGMNWNFVSSQLGYMQTLRSICFPSQEIGFICGVGGVILKTSNAGVNWYRLNSNTSYTLSDIFFIDVNTGFAVGSIGKVICTSNGGISWDSMTSPSSYSLLSVRFLNAMTGLVSGSDYMYKTTNRGLNWYVVKSDNAICCIQFLNSLTGYCFGYFTTPPGTQTHVYKTTNAGETWEQICYWWGIWLKDMFFVDVNLGFATNGVNVYKTTNGGVNWFNIFGHGGESVYFTDQNTGYIPFYKTTNSGLNWYYQDLGIEANYLINSIGFVNNNIGFMVGGYGGTIIKTTDGGGPPVSIEHYTEKIPINFSLSQNYPNPFNPVTRIKYQIPLLKGVSAGRGVLVKLIIYDILGREIETLVNETQRPGSYEANWDGSRYASGVYFYRLYIDDASTPLSITKKMVLIK